MNEKIFKGESSKINGHVFKIHAEKPLKGQFQDTLDTLKIYSSTIHQQYINSLTSLFINTNIPTVDTPTEPEVSKPTDTSGTIITIPISKFQESVYNKEIKLWIKDNRRLKATLTSLYNVVWCQSSKLMQNKLVAVDNFSNVQSMCHATELLKSIRGISNKIETNASVYDVLA